MMPEPRRLPQIGPYETLEVLTESRELQYIRVRNPALNRLETIHLLKPRAYAAISQRERFLQAYRSLAFVRHTNMARIYDVGRLDNGWVYASVEEVHGTPLATLVTGYDKPPLDRVINWTIELADLLDALARDGIHTAQFDLNDIVITPSGRAVLVDLQTQYFRPNNSRRSPCPCPEQTVGSIDVRCGIYNLGIVLYESLTGSMFYARESRRFLPDHPPWLIDIVERCLQIDPEQRYSTGRALAEALACNMPDRKHTLLSFGQMALTVLAGILLVGVLYTCQDRRSVDTALKGARGMIESTLHVADDTTRTPELIKSLMKYDTFQPLINQLTTERDRGNLTFGKADFFLNPNLCYIFVFEKTDEALIAVLAPGDRDRIDLLSERRVQNVPKYLAGKGAIYVHLTV